MPSIITCATALNPYFNVNGVDFLIESISLDLEFLDDGFASKSKSYFKEYLEGLYNLRYAKYGNPTQSSQASGGATSSKASGGNNYSRLLNGLKAHTKKARTDPTMSSEFERHETMFLVLSRMAMDLISVQASSVAFESVFLKSGRVLSIRRTRLTPTSLEMCMCLNDHLDAKERKQDKCPLEIPLDFEEDVFDDEVQRNEAIPLSDEKIALHAISEGTLSLGGPRKNKKAEKLSYPRYNKLFIDYFLSRNNDTAKRSDANMHRESQDEVLPQLRVATKGDMTYGMEIHDTMLNYKIKKTSGYKKYLENIKDIVVPMA
uniref:Zinc finger BED domain-containing protein RICESLEEPER 2-like n=1 Tax=Tanacetum cinerariifolium TaxID=118510 RepID=A0A6L2NLV9_TANCI|nr:zinc finger BED domain-containing protein RICESLEEPER 2-like [Tanacetum cinerariifolium]